MGTLHIEDDDDQLKVPHSDIPPVRAVEAPAALEQARPSTAAVTGQATSLSAPKASASRQIPGLAFRAASDALGPRPSNTPSKEKT